MCGVGDNGNDNIFTSSEVFKDRYNILWIHKFQYLPQLPDVVFPESCPSTHFSSLMNIRYF